MEGLADLGFNLSTLVAQVVNFVILFGLLYLVAYKPVTRMLDQRAQKIKDSLEQAEATREKATHAEEEIRKRLEEASREGQERIARALRAGEETKQKAQQEARQEAEALLVRARADIQRERDDAIQRLRQEFGDLTILAAQKVIKRALDKETHRQLIEEVLVESTRLKKG